MNIKIIVLNLWNGGKLMPGILDFLEKENADVLMLQEVFNGIEPGLPDYLRSVEVIQKKFGFVAHDFAPCCIDVRKEGKIPLGNAVFSKFPIVSSDIVFFNELFSDHYDDSDPKNWPICPRNLQHVVLASPAGEVNIFNTQGVWDLDGDSYSERRRNMSEKIITAVKDKPRVILAGDTNAKPTNQAMRNIEEHLVPVFALEERTTSFNLSRKDLQKFPGYATAVVDLMYVSSDIKVVAHDCPNVDVSDHLPLTATLEIR